MADGKQRILNIAHRGASAYYPENTMAAFKGAVEMGADMFELDVRLSKDGVPIIFHNEKLDAPIKATGMVSNSIAADLKKLDAGSWYHSDFAAERIPTLEEALAFAKGTIALNIELKTDENQTARRLENISLELVEKYNMKDAVIFSSFDMKALERIKLADSTISTGLLFANSVFSRSKPSELVKKCNADAFHCTYREFTRKRHADLKEHNIPVTVYTVNSIKRMKKLCKMDVNGIITDKPDVLSRIIFKV